MTKSVSTAFPTITIFFLLLLYATAASASLSKSPPSIDSRFNTAPRPYYDQAYVPGRLSRPCDNPHACVRDYRRFLKLAAPYAQPRTQEEVFTQISESLAGAVDVYTEPLPPEDLREVIVDALNLHFILDDIDNAPILVDVTSIKYYRRYAEYLLTFRDRWVGAFTAVLLVPYGEGPFPVVIANHGHGSSPEQFREEYFGEEYPGQGFAILMIQFRNNDADGPEVEMCTDYLLDGFAYGGMRIYETLLAFQFLLEQDNIDPDRIFLIGHSGGSVLANLTIRIENRFAGYVSDLQWIYVSNYWIDDLIPDLFPYHLLINDFSTASMPVLTVEYGYPNGPQEIFDFFRSLQ